MKRALSGISTCGRLVLMIALGLSPLLLAGAIIAGMGNADFRNRSPQSITLPADKEPSRYGLKVRLVVHRLLVEENAVEVSLIVQARYDDLPQGLKDETPCLTLVYEDGGETGSLPKTLDVDCKQFVIPGSAVGEAISAETPPFKLTAFPSVASYPFDDWEFFPVVKLLARANLNAPAEYSVERMLPGKELKVEGTAYNWKVYLQRTVAEQVLVLAVGIAFLALSFLISWRMFSRDAALSGMQELLALAGFVVAIAGLRDMLGVTRTTGVSIWEIMVVGFPMMFIFLGILYPTVIRILRNRDRKFEDARKATKSTHSPD